MEQIEKNFVMLIKSIINGEETNEADLALSDTSLQELYKIASKQDLISVIATALRKNNVELPDYYEKAEEWNVYRCVQQQFEEEQIRSLFNQEGIQFIFLKGSVVRNYYPSPEFRTCADIDVLVDDVDRAIGLLKEKLEYTGVSDYCDHHVSIHSPSSVLVEIHNCLSVEYPILENPWEFTEKIDRSEYKLKDGLFYLYHIAHMKKHFTYGGCGIRSFIDLWVIKENMKIKADIGLLMDCGLDRFEQAAGNLTEYWFGNSTKKADKVILLMEGFIFNGGLYGDTTQSVAISRVSYGRFSYLFHRLFLPMKEMKKLFSIMDKKPMFLQCILYVPCTIRRWLRLVFNGQGKRAAAEFRANAVLKEDKNISILCRELGISRDLSY